MLNNVSKKTIKKEKVPKKLHMTKKQQKTIEKNETKLKQSKNNQNIFKMIKKRHIKTKRI